MLAKQKVGISKVIIYIYSDHLHQGSNFLGKWIFTVSPLSLTHVPNTLLRELEDKTLLFFRSFRPLGKL